MGQRFLLCAVILGMATPASAGPFSIHVLDSTHSVTLKDWTYYGGVSTETVDTTTGTAPVSDQYLVTAPPPYSFVEGGTASADVFEISTWTMQGKSKGQDGDLDHMWAYATTALTFVPVATGTASIDLTFLLGGYANIYSESMIKLVDLTVLTDVWSVGWQYKDIPTAQALAAATTTIATQFDASHTYQLTLFGRTDARDDWESLTAQVGGLQTVPEPSTLLLVGIGAGAAAMKRRRLRSNK